jgi:mRNA-degrading endonuclease toxin of MazEF toxin-antitoxin module
VGPTECSLSREELAVNPFPRRAHFYWVPIPGEYRQKRRPALVVSIESRNRLANDVLVVPASTTLRPSPTHVRLKKGQGGIPRDSVLKCEQITALPKELLSEAALGGPLSDAVMGEVERGVIRSIGIPID